MSIEELKCANNDLKLVQQISDLELKVMSKKYREHVISTITQDELIDIISNKLPISLEDTKSFVSGAQTGYISSRIFTAIALASKDAEIEMLKKRIDYLEAICEGEGLEY